MHYTGAGLGPPGADGRLLSPASQVTRGSTILALRRQACERLRTPVPAGNQFSTANQFGEIAVAASDHRVIYVGTVCSRQLKAVTFPPLIQQKPWLED